MRSGIRLSIAEYFNEYFTSIASDLDEKVSSSSTDPLSYLTFSTVTSFFLAPVTASEINAAINAIKMSKRTNDVVPVKILSHIYSSIIDPLVALINVSFET